MKRTTPTLAILLVTSATVLSSLLVGTSSAATAKLKVCGQIRGGPAHDWSFPPSVARDLGIPARVRGTTWTVVADGIGCSFALGKTSALLKQWPKAKPGARLAGPAGWTCAKDTGFVGHAGKGSPGGSCLKTGAIFTFIGSGSYTLAQVKQLAATGKLPGGR
jgi:hypothetical protein